MKTEHALEAILAYHERTKHHFHRYAASLGFLDWASQPDPFRRYEGAELIRLKRREEDGPSYEAVLHRRVDVRPPDFEALSGFFYHALALSAWKGCGGERWALRVNPSSGNLHPTEAYLAAGPLTGLGESPAVYHYAPREHGLERRAALSPAAWKRISGEEKFCDFLVGLSSVHWREAWKYGERAFRYCQHDAGHALAAISIAAAMYGWRARAVDGVSDKDIAALFGLDRRKDFHEDEREAPDMLIAVRADSVRGEAAGPPGGAMGADALSNWSGRANALSESHVPWEAIAAAWAACEEGAARRAPYEAWAGHWDVPAAAEGAVSGADSPAGGIIRRRRSAQAMDGETSISREAFYKILARTLPVRGRPPFDAAPWSGHVHFGLFVHRVRGLAAGLYAMARRADRVGFLKEKMFEGFDWIPAQGAGELPLYLLKAGDARVLAAQLSCHQAIAADGVFSLGMLAEFEEPLRRYGSGFYRRIFWEAGMIGQVLYLEAEAAGVSGTGIGCYFDDPVHKLFGLKDRALQSLYHFTVGGALQDARLESHPAYAHLDG